LSARIGHHIRSNVIGYLALFVALSGTAYAVDGPLPGQNQVGSQDIIDGEVQNADLGSNAVSGSKVFPSSLTGSDVAPGGLTGSDVATDSLTSSDIGAGAVAASEVADGSLGTAELATSIPAARVTRSSSQGVPNATNTTLNFTSERYDTAGMHSTSSNLFAVYAPVTGIYEISANIRWLNGFLSGGASIELVRNGNTVLAREENPSDHALSISTMARLVAGEHIRVVVFQNSGGSQSIASIPQSSPEFSMTWLAPGP
jgi:hypothetical protein